MPFNIRTRKKRIRLLTVLLGIVIFVCALLFSNRTPLHQRILIQGIGIDKTETGYLVTVQANATSSGSQTEFYQSEGATVYEALNHLSDHSGKVPFYTHNTIVLFGRSCAKENLSSVLDFFVRYHQTRPTESVYLAENDAAALLSLQKEPELSADGTTLSVSQYVLSERIASLADDDPTQPQRNVTVLELVNGLYPNGKDAVLPILSTDGTEIVTSGCAIFSEEAFVQDLGEDDALGLALLQNKVQGGAVPISLPDGTATLSFLKSDCSVTAEVVDGVPQFTIQLHCSLNINEIARPITQPLAQTDFAVLASAAEAQLTAQLKHTIQIVCACHADPVGFGQQLLHQQTDWWKSHSDQWKDWIDRCQYTVSVSAEIAEEGQEMSPQVLDFP